MPKRISSKLTFYSKFVSPILVVLWLPIFAYFLWNSNPSIVWSSGTILFSIAVPLIAISVAVFFGMRLKKVSVDDDNLYVSDYRIEITIPIREIENISEFYLSEPRLVTITLRSPSEFGQKIKFIATYRLFGTLSSHPVVDELWQLVAAKARSGD